MLTINFGTLPLIAHGEPQNSQAKEDWKVAKIRFHHPKARPLQKAENLTISFHWQGGLLLALHPQLSHVLYLTSENQISKIKNQSTYINPINFRRTIRGSSNKKGKQKIFNVKSPHFTLLLIKLWRAMTLRMREER